MNDAQRKYLEQFQATGGQTPEQMSFLEKYKASLSGAVPQAVKDVADDMKINLKGSKAALMESLETMVPGVKQAYGTAFDPEMEAREGAKINQIQDKYRADKEAGTPVFNALGVAAPYVVGGLAAGGLKTGAMALPRVAQALRYISPVLKTGKARAAAASAAGAAGSAASHLLRPIGDPNEGRTEGLALPTLAGAVIPGALVGGGEAKRFFKNTQRAEDAAEDIIKTSTGATRDTSTKEAYDSAVGKVSGKVDDTQAAWKARRVAVEKSPTTKVTMNNMSDIDQETLPDELKYTLSSQFQNSAKKGSTHTSAILDPVTEKPISYPNSQSVEDVRETIRIVRKKMRSLPPDSDKIGAYKRIEDTLQKDLDAWGEESVDNAVTLEYMRTLDKDYAKDVAPLLDPSDKGRPSGAWRGKDGAYTERDLLARTGGADQGGELQQVMDDFPEAKDDLSRYAGSKMYGKDISPENFDPSTRRDVLFPNESPARLTRTAEMLRKGQGESLPSRFLRGMEHIPAVGGALEKVRRGVPLRNAKPAKQRSLIADLLRGYGIGAGTDEYSED
jgi:hypothetical protein